MIFGATTPHGRKNMTTATLKILADDLPALNGEYALSDEQIADFRRDGHILRRGLSSKDVSAPAVRREIKNLLAPQSTSK